MAEQEYPTVTRDSDDKTPTVSLVKQTVVTEILGVLALPEDSPAKLIDDGAGNSTRWVFDVDASGGGSLEVQLGRVAGVVV